jgi:two-component system, chemotaxis family, chemotaxis protein CheY
VARILLIDDQECIRRPLKLLLERAGHEVFQAANGMEAVRLWRQSSGDLVITDIHMPEKNGLETILELRQLSPLTPILAMSGGDRNGRVDVLGDATQLGAFRTLAKPFSLREMLEAVEQLLRESTS